MLRLWLIGGVTGTGTGLLFLSFYYLFTFYKVFSGWEFILSLCSPAIAATLTTVLSKSKFSTTIILFPIAYLTFLIPIFGASFGASGNDQLVQIPFLAFIGGIFWTTPFVVTNGIIRLIRK